MYNRLFIVFILFLTSCNSVENNSTVQEVVISDGEKWLKDSLEFYFNDDERNLSGFESLCTKEYGAFKIDLINSVFDHGLTDEEMKNKWGRRWLQKEHDEVGFILPGQDYGEIEIIGVSYKGKSEIGNLIFNVTIEDIDNIKTYKRSVVLYNSKNTFLIDAVMNSED